MKALTLFMSSGGMSRIDTWEMTIQKYLNATFEYHQCNNIYEAIKIMDRSEIDIIPTFKLRRRKTGETYRSFISPEAVKAINNYLLTRDNLKNTDKLFDVNFSYLNTMFKETNDKLGFGQINNRENFQNQINNNINNNQPEGNLQGNQMQQRNNDMNNNMNIRRDMLPTNNNQIRPQNNNMNNNLPTNNLRENQIRPNMQHRKRNAELLNLRQQMRENN